MKIPPILFTILCTALSAGAGELVLPESLHAVPRGAPVSTGDNIVLGEIVSIVGCPPEWTTRLNELPVAKAAMPGQTRVISRQELTAALRKAQFTGLVEIPGDDDFNVVAASQLISGKRFVEAATAAVRERLGAAAAADLRLETLLAPPDLEVRPGAVEFQAEFPNNNSGPVSGTQSLRVRLTQGGARIAEHLVTLKLRLVVPVIVAAATIHAGDIFSESNLTIARTELASGAALNGSNLKALLGLQARATIEAGQPLTRALIAEQAAIKRGESVVVRMKVNGLEIAARGESRNDAARGDVVRIVLPQSDGEVTARVTGAHEARIGE